MREHLSHGFRTDWQMTKACSLRRQRSRFQSRARPRSWPPHQGTTGVSVLVGNSISTSGTSPMRSNVERRQSHRSELLQTQFASLRGVFVCLANAIAQAQPPRWTRHNGRGCGALSFSRDAKKSTSTSKVVSAPLTRGGTAPKHPFGISIHSPEELFYASLLTSI